jgi:peptide/nickel transport system substrate-binding protein
MGNFEPHPLKTGWLTSWPTYDLHTSRAEAAHKFRSRSAQFGVKSRRPINWPVWRKLDRSQRRPAPSPRVWAAGGIAAAIGAITFLILWLTSPSPPPSTAVPVTDEPALRRGGTLTGTLRAGPASFNPYAASGEPHETIARLTQARLVRINRSTDQVEPWLAESWTASTFAPGTSVDKPGETYTFKLRPNILWSDGTPLTAEDIVFTSRAWPARTGAASPAVRAVDPLTVEITFPLPSAAHLRLLDSLPILPRHKLQQAADAGTFARAWGPATPAPEIAGLGPFVLTENKPGARLTFSRNPQYWRKTEEGTALPYLDRLVLEIIPDPDDELKRLLAGELDFVQDEIRPQDYAALRAAEQKGQLRLYDLGPRFDADALWLNLSPASPAGKSWLRQDDFRLAISAAVDRRAFCNAVSPGGCDPIAGPITSGNRSWFMADLPMPHDPARARVMLAALGMQDRNADGFLDDDSGRPVRFSLLVPRGLATAGPAAAFIRDELGKVGIGVDLITLDSNAVRNRWQKGDYEAIYDRIAMPDTDPALNLDFWLSSGSTHAWNPRQARPATEWERQIDELMQKQARTADRVGRLQTFADVQRIFSQHMPAIYFGAPYVHVAMSPRVLNASPSRQSPPLLWSADTLATTVR